MTKYICDVCNTEIDIKELVRIKYQVVKGKTLIDEDFYTSSLDGLFKDMCVSCAKKFITQRVIDEVVTAHIEKRKEREAKRQKNFNDSSAS